MIYLTQRDDEFRPLAEQIDLLVHENDYLYVLKNQLVAVSRWHHFHTLTNPDNEFDEVPLKVELRLGKEKPFEEITGKSFELNPKSNRLSINEEPLMYRNFEVKITNISDHELHVAVLVLNSDFSITTTPLNDQVIKLGPGESKFFNEHKNSVSKIIFDQYKEIYNWKSEWFHYKFIFNNYEDFTTSLADFRQEALKNPILPVFLKRRFRGAKSEGGSYEEKEDVVERWGTSISTIHLKNPGYNIVPDKVNRNWKNFSSDNRIAPFIGQLYYDSRFDGLVIRSQSKTNRLEEGRADRGLGEIKVNVGNFLDNARRRRIFERAKRKMPGKPVVIAEGDSWFLYPFLVKDTIDYVMEDFPVRSIAAAGDTLENYKNSNQLLTETADIRPEFVLISGGGNDIIGPEIVDILKKNAGKGLLPQEYLNEKYPERRKKLIELYSYFFEELRKHHSVKHIFVHGYDYVRADQPEEVIQKGWVNKYMIEYGIKNAGDRERLIRYLVDNFNSDLEELVSKYDHVSYLNMRGLVNENEWYDEIHPNDAGFGKVGSQFINAIKQF